jgi:Ala-tRNA(Pro) deacylase
MTDIFRFLEANGIAYERFDHPPVYTVNDVKLLTPDIPGKKTKNLFLRDKKGVRHLLVTVPAEKRVDLKKLTNIIGATRLSFGSSDRLKKYLGIDPGAVSLLAIINDPDKQVEVYIDNDLWESEAYQYHPLVNTSTLAIEHEHLKRFLESDGHEFKIIEVPALD